MDWEKLLVGILGLGLLVLFLPRIRSMFRESRDAPKDWQGVLVPIALVVLFVIVLTQLV